jgi:two-component system sensor histidine kinase RegB
MSAVITDPQRSSAAVNLGRLVVYRHLALVAQGIAVPSAIYGLGLQLDAFPLVAIISIYGIYNGITWWRLRHGAVITESQLFSQLLVDVAEMAALLYLTGGASNPFVWFFLVPLTLTAASLPAAYSWAMAAITSVCYSILMFYNVPLPHQHGSDFNMHVVGMWTGYILSAALIAYFAVHMNSTLRQRDLALARAREQALRDERLVALGTLAAGAAHEMGTPLATMAVVTKELEREYAHLPELTGQLNLVRSQIDRCKKILSSMAAAAGQNRADAGYRLSLNQYLEDVVQGWRQSRPAAVVRYSMRGDCIAPKIVAEQTLSQSIINALNNAADASEHDVEVTAQWSAQMLILEICDRGPGLDSEAEARAGELLFTTKAPGEGHGIGLFLAQSTISRLGGSMRLSNRAGGGACIRIELPLTQLLVQA